MNTLELLFWAICAVGFLVCLALMVICVHASWNDRQEFGPGRRARAEDWPASPEERECQRLARTRFVVECNQQRGRKVLGQRLQLNGELKRLW